jgi:glycosyltransferase involved in cell wall biosynthesis
MPSITFVTPGFSNHAVGGYKVVYEYANYLASMGHQVTIAQLRPAQYRESGSLSKRLLRALQYRIGRHRRPSWCPLDPRIVVINHPVQREQAIPQTDVIVATAMETAHFSASVAQERGIPGAYFIQHYEDWGFGPDAVDATWRLPLQNIVIAPWLLEKGNQLGVQSVLVANAIDPVAFPSGPQISERPLQVLAMASDMAWKRTDLISEIMTSLLDAVPEVSLKVFGAIARPSSLPSSVDYIQNPSSSELRILYQQSRVFICASDTEGFGLPPAEAMSSRSAVVSTDIGGVRSYADGIALFSPVGDAKRLTKNVIGLLANEADCEERASAGLGRMRAYLPNDAGAAFEAELLSLMAPGNRSAKGNTTE